MRASRWCALLVLAACGDKDPNTGDDTAVEADADADSDSDSDTDTDADSDVELWSWCPGPEAWEGDSSWSGELQVGDAALYCWNFQEGVPLEEVPALKAQLRLVPGTFPIPALDGAGELALPLCVALPGGGAGPITDGVGAVSIGSSTWDGVRYSAVQGELPLTDAAGHTWSLNVAVRQVGPEDEPPEPVRLNGGGVDPWGEGSAAEFGLIPDGGQAWAGGYRVMDACSDGPYWENQWHTVQFEGGEVELQLQIGQSPASTEPGAFVAARGELDGESFEVTDYWSLFYSPEHHHFSRHFGLRFEQPIGDACGLRVEHLDPWEDQEPTVISTTNCDLSVLSTRALLGESFRR